MNFKYLFVLSSSWIWEFISLPFSLRIFSFFLAHSHTHTHFTIYTYIFFFEQPHFTIYNIINLAFCLLRVFLPATSWTWFCRCSPTGEKTIYHCLYCSTLNKSLKFFLLSNSNLSLDIPCNWGLIPFKVVIIN